MKAGKIQVISDAYCDMALFIDGGWKIFRREQSVRIDFPALSQIHRGTAAHGLCVNKQDAVLNVAAIFVIFIISYIEKMKGYKERAGIKSCTAAVFFLPEVFFFVCFVCFIGTSQEGEQTF
ncbi:MAG: hypothetical protein ACLVL2_14425 [Bacteroides cellulosilyticus]